MDYDDDPFEDPPPRTAPDALAVLEDADAPPPPPPFRRADVSETGSRRRRGCDVDGSRRRRGRDVRIYLRGDEPAGERGRDVDLSEETSPRANAAATCGSISEEDGRTPRTFVRVSDRRAPRYHDRAPMIIARSLYVTPHRSTHMDVMVTTNTSRRYEPPGAAVERRPPRKAKAKRPGALAPRCRLPYEADEAAARTAKAATPSQKLMDGIARKRTNDAMHEERRLFMARLIRERDAKTETEADAAVRCQAAVRGRLARKPPRVDAAPAPPPSRGADAWAGLRDAAKRRQEKVEREKAFDRELCAELLELATKAGLAPVRGVTLAPPKKASRRRAREARDRAKKIEDAVHRVQAYARALAARKRAVDVLATMRRSTRQQAVSAIQRNYRGHQAREAALLRKAHGAARLVQARYRRVLAAQRLISVKTLLLRRKREEDAVIRVQSAWRRRQARHHVAGLARAMVATAEAAGARDPLRRNFSQHLKWRDEAR